MKRTTTLMMSLLLITSMGLNAQTWKKGLSEIENPGFKDMQHVFDAYWQGKTDLKEHRNNKEYADILNSHKVIRAMVAYKYTKSKPFCQKSGIRLRASGFR